MDSFHTFSDEQPGGLHKILVGLPRISTRRNWMEKLVFCAVFIYLSVYYLFIYCLFFVCFLIIFKGLVVGSCINYCLYLFIIKLKYSFRV